MRLVSSEWLSVGMPQLPLPFEHTSPIAQSLSPRTKRRAANAAAAKHTSIRRLLRFEDDWVSLDPDTFAE